MELGLRRVKFCLSLHLCICFLMFPFTVASEPRTQLLKVPQCVCCEWVGCRILSYGNVQMIPFSTASEPGEMLDETSQWEVSQCIAVDFLSFFLVQMHWPLCCAFGGYPCQKCLQGVFAFCGVPAPPGI